MPAGKPAAISFSLEELAEADTPAVFLEKHQHLLVQVSVPPDTFSIFIVASEQQQQVVEQQFGIHDNCRLLTGTMESLAPMISEIEKELQLTATPTIITRDLHHGTATFTYQLVQYRTVYPDQTLLHFATYGHQCAQMNARFYEDFTNDRMYFLKADVLRAYGYIQPAKGAEASTPHNFQKDFIDNFEEGTSIFYPGW
ncbi:hypothetical protein [Chitinophaga eiseniae]|nr:hypothetical protein [Chitinophaga eiseniae]